MTPSMRRVLTSSLHTDQYQLTMAQLYLRNGIHERTAQFDHFFRSCPDYGGHQAGFCINAGLEWFLEWARDARFGEDETAYLASLRDGSGQRVFGEDFLEWLRDRPLLQDVTMRAVPEGRVVHPNVPISVVQGPLALVQILETPLLNLHNLQTLIATKAARIQRSARGRMIIEFGLRRGQEMGAHAGARGAVIGGADFTSNVAASRVLGLPPKGTHAHSMVEAFMALGDGELGAFRAYADVYPDACLLLVDTIDTLHSGVPNAIRVFEELRRKGHRPIGIRLDSGDLAYLAVQAAKMLNKAGFEETNIVLSNQLDEVVITQILDQISRDAPAAGVDPDQLINRLVFGVGTRLITSRGDAALDGVYKLVAVRGEQEWIPTSKISETAAKSLVPGQKGVWRLYDSDGKATADVLSLPDEDLRTPRDRVLYHPFEEGVQRTLHAHQVSAAEPLLTEIVADGRIVCDCPPLDAIRKRRQADVDKLHAGVTRLVNPHVYHVSLTAGLHTLKHEVINRIRHAHGH